MTKKDYKLIAECINGSLKYGKNKIHTLNWLINELNCRLKQDNNKFDKEKFVSVCLK